MSKKMKKLIIVIFTLMLCLTSEPTTYVLAQNTPSVYYTEITHVSDWNVSISSSNSYVSKTFVPTGDSVMMLFGGGGYQVNYTCYIEKRDSSGLWTIVSSDYTSGTLSMNCNVEPGSNYRIRVKTNSNTLQKIHVEVIERI